MSGKPLSRKAALLLGATQIFLRPKLAADAKLDLSSAFAGITTKNAKAKRAALVKAIEDMTAGKLAADADINDLTELLDQLEDVVSEEAVADAEPATDPNAAVPVKTAAQAVDAEAPWGKAKGMLEGKVDDATMKALDAIMCPKAADAEAPEGESEEDKKKREAAARDAQTAATKEPPITKAAMDAALAGQRKNLIAERKALQVAEREVIPYMGQVAVAMDSASDVYKAALEHIGVDVGPEVPAAGYRAMLLAMSPPKRGARDGNVPVVAMDTASTKNYADMFPGAGNIGQA